MIPDIVIQHIGNILVLDTKWKNLGQSKPSPEDLRQMYVYSRFHGHAVAALMYPGKQVLCENLRFIKEDEYRTLSDWVCVIISIPVEVNIAQWQRAIADAITNSFLGKKLNELPAKPVG